MWSLKKITSQKTRNYDQFWLFTFGPSTFFHPFCFFYTLTNSHSHTYTYTWHGVEFSLVAHPKHTLRRHTHSHIHLLSKKNYSPPSSSSKRPKNLRPYSPFFGLSVRERRRRRRQLPTALPRVCICVYWLWVRFRFFHHLIVCSPVYFLNVFFPSLLFRLLFLICFFMIFMFVFLFFLFLFSKSF